LLNIVKVKQKNRSSVFCANIQGNFLITNLRLVCYCDYSVLRLVCYCDYSVLRLVCYCDFSVLRLVCY